MLFILEIIDKVRGFRYFIKLDIRWGYNNIWIKDGDEWKVVFNINWGLFEFLVMFFGFINVLFMF